MTKQEENLPVHLGLVLDGNRRWAKQRNLPSLEGHRRGYENFKDITRDAFNKGIKYVSAYIFSTENWDRTVKEVNYLMNLAYRMLAQDIAELHKENIKVVWLGSTSKLSSKLLKAMKDAEELTKDNTKGVLCICFNYGGHQEIADAVKLMIESGIDRPDQVTPEAISEFIYKPEIPPVDLVIRTSGEQRISGFMLWRVAYAELMYSDKYWPDFTRQDLGDMLADYSNRQRRFGK